MPDFLENFWRKNLAEIRENKIRFAAIIISLGVAVIAAANDYASADTEISIETPAQVPQIAEPVQPVTAAVNSNVTPLIGANSSELYVYDPFEEPEPPPPPLPPIPEPPTIPPDLVEIPVAQEPTPSPAPAETFILRGIAINGTTKTAIIHKFINSDDKNTAENLLLSVGDNLGVHKIIDINENSVALDDGSRIPLTP